MARRSRNKVIWCDRGWQFTYFGFCPSEKAWEREMKMLGLSGGDYALSSGTSGSTTKMTSAKGKNAVIVRISADMDRDYRKDPAGVVAVIVHEAVHVWQFILDHMGEAKPSPELEAYAVQAIFSQLFDAYLDTRIRK